MKPFQIAFLVAALAAVLFVSQLVRSSGIDSDGAALMSKIEDYNGVQHLILAYARSIWDGATLGASSGGDIFAAAKDNDQEGAELNAERAVLISRHDSAVFYRNAGLIACVAALALGVFLKRSHVGFPPSKSSLNQLPL